MRILTLTLLFALSSFTIVAQPVRIEIGKGELAIVYDPTQPNEEVSAVWLSYCIGRLHYVMEHRSEYPRKLKGELIPTFKEDVEGRLVGLDTYLNRLEKKEMEPDSYWDDVKKASDAGFLDEYVWVNFYRDAWAKTKKPANLEKFTLWKTEHLSNHKPVTYGGLMGK